MIALVVVAALVQAPSNTAADQVVLWDRTVVLGQVLEPAPRGKIVVAVRRAWLKHRLPARLKVWERQEATWVAQARTERLQRVRAWKRERVAAPEGSADPIAAWLTAEIGRLEAGPGEPTPLMAIQIERTQVRSLVRRPPDRARMLRQAWRGALEEPETQPLADLKEQLEGRGFAQSDVDPAPIDALLPLPFEPEATWLTRRAATEVGKEPALRYVRYLGLVLPEGANADGLGLAGAAASSLKGLLGEDPAEDPLVAKLADATRRGRVGVVVTKLDMAEDLATVRVESALLVRSGANGWTPAIVRPATVRVDDVPDNEGGPLGNDPQVQAAFKVVEGLGLGGVSPELKQRSLTMGAATRRALGQAQSALARDLETLVLPVDVAAPPARRD